MPGHCGSRTVGGNEPSPSTLPTSDTMIKEIVLALAVFSCTTYVQGNPMALMALSGAGGAGGSGVGSMMMRLLNNPYTLCKETEGQNDELRKSEVIFLHTKYTEGCTNA
uniref:Uncharacterized protein n=1 Tax=Magallana gigas TaxID=29159 RepID=A0A8W8L2F2_MAGGI